eukprot:m.135638 g.135638  ORF g.135638 m.135638 type:complete len:224 (-) comp10104_c0_seq1:137-808(-)
MEHKDEEEATKVAAEETEDVGAEEAVEGYEEDEEGDWEGEEGEEDGEEEAEEDDVAALMAEVDANATALKNDKEELQEALKNQPTPESREEVDGRSVFVQNVDYSVTEKDLQAFFKDCGVVRRVTIPRSFTKTPKGFAYVEFTDPTSVETAKALTNEMLHGRPVTIVGKRTNRPGMRKTTIRGRGGRGGYRGRSRGRGYFRGRGRGQRGGRGRGVSVYFSTSS